MSKDREIKSLKTHGGLEFKIKAWLNALEEEAIEIKAAEVADEFDIKTTPDGVATTKISVVAQAQSVMAQTRIAVETVLVELDQDKENILDRFLGLRRRDRDFISIEIEKSIEDAHKAKKN